MTEDDSAQPVPEKLFEINSSEELVLPELQVFNDPEGLWNLLGILSGEEAHRNIAGITTDEKYYKMDFGPGGAVYIKSVVNTLEIIGAAGRREQEPTVYALDVSPEGQVIGIGRAIRKPPPDYHDYPFVGSTDTKHGFGGRGLNLRRLIVLNEACKQFFNDTLGSGYMVDSSEEAPARKTWKRLVELGLATKANNGTFRFIS